MGFRYARRKPSLITLNAIAQNLGISQFELLKRAGYMYDPKQNVVDENIYVGKNGILIDIAKCGTGFAGVFPEREI